jgi:hypothetical protein
MRYEDCERPITLELLVFLGDGGQLNGKRATWDQFGASMGLLERLEARLTTQLHDQRQVGPAGHKGSRLVTYQEVEAEE